MRPFLIQYAWLIQTNDMVAIRKSLYPWFLLQRQINQGDRRMKF